MTIFGISTFDGIGNINDFTNLSIPVSSAAGKHRGYQHAQRMGWPSDRPNQENPRIRSYHGETQTKSFYNTNHSDFPPAPPFIPLPPPANAYTSSVSPPHHSQDRSPFVPGHIIINLNRLSSVNHDNRYAPSLYHPSPASSANYTSSYMNNARDGMEYNTPMQHYGYNSTQYPPPQPTTCVTWVG